MPSKLPRHVSALSREIERSILYAITHLCYLSMPDPRLSSVLRTAGETAGSTEALVGAILVLFLRHIARPKFARRIRWRGGGGWQVLLFLSIGCFRVSSTRRSLSRSIDFLICALIWLLHESNAAHPAICNPIHVTYTFDAARYISYSIA